MHRAMGLCLLSVCSACVWDTDEPPMMTLPPPEVFTVEEPSASLAALDEEDIGDVLTEVLLRHRMYAALREALPLQSVVCASNCHTSSEQGGGLYTFELSADCVAPSPDARGIVVGEASPEEPCVEGLVWLSLEYRDVSVFGVTVDGTEHRSLTAGEEVMTEVVVAMEQDGLTFDYTFHHGMQGATEPSFFYEFPGPEGLLVVQLTNPQTLGAFATATILGQDASLTCEIRASAWEPGDAARGTCEDGTIFGL